MLENKFKTKLVSDLKGMFPGCIIAHLDPNEIQGIPDLLILHGNTWASLEGKKSHVSPYQPNQEYYIERMNNMSFSSVVYPENKHEVLEKLQNYFGGNYEI